MPAKVTIEVRPGGATIITGRARKRFHKHAIWVQHGACHFVFLNGIAVDGAIGTPRTLDTLKVAMWMYLGAFRFVNHARCTIDALIVTCRTSVNLKCGANGIVVR
jgi:hypothetical protein